MINPAKDPNLGKVGCGRVLVCVAEKDALRDRGLYYCELLEKSGWNGALEVMEAKGEDHVFHLVNPTCENAIAMLHKIFAFISHEDSASINTFQKLPLVIYFHGGGFLVQTPFSSTCHSFINSLVALANVVVVSVHYRRAPEHPIPTAYDDSWAAVKWVSSHSRGKGQSEWLNSNADFSRVFFAGDSAGANIATNMAIRVGLLSDDEEVVSTKLNGIVMVHPYFCGKEPIGNEPNIPELKALLNAVWKLGCPSSSSGSDDPLINPAMDPNLGKVRCGRVLVCVAKKDGLRD
ncbi:hypothetical protein FEM48_Zijuj09G0120000 [Ziziphus jujuba var. spinosa]|uniref:Alpha/beta hydrolase fold-3 domain-containing protein n=1 Tax=Ziziphus jujuba var. spinosa TaxID=714518 RepID=A0A978USW3_ZIZJJ|nr:hypothetical protein FEM48_Zijuj09G0120000 [Ziziphus jujuba var. spinosa]